MTITELRDELARRSDVPFSPATVAYWLEWFEAHSLVPHTVESFLEEVQALEDHVAEVVLECIPAEWYAEDDEEANHA